MAKKTSKKAAATIKAVTGKKSSTTKVAPKKANKKKPLKSAKKKILKKGARPVKKAVMFAAAAAAAPNFKFIFDLSGVSVQSLDVNGTIINNPPLTGKLFAGLDTPFRVLVNATLEAGDGNGSLQLKTIPKNKNVFSEAEEFSFNGNSRGGLTLDDVEIPS